MWNKVVLYRKFGGVEMRIRSIAGVIRAPRVLTTLERFKLLAFAIKLEKMKNAS